MNAEELVEQFFDAQLRETETIRRFLQAVPPDLWAPFDVRVAAEFPQRKRAGFVGPRRRRLVSRARHSYSRRRW